MANKGHTVGNNNRDATTNPTAAQHTQAPRTINDRSLGPSALAIAK